jgi:hypothetical protein
MMKDVYVVNVVDVSQDNHVCYMLYTADERWYRWWWWLINDDGWWKNTITTYHYQNWYSHSLLFWYHHQMNALVSILIVISLYLL